MPIAYGPARTAVAALGLLTLAAAPAAAALSTDDDTVAARLLERPATTTGDALLRPLMTGATAHATPLRKHRRMRHASRVARLTKTGRAIAPPGAPREVRQIIKAGNRIAHLPYVWGGGHGGWKAAGYDCSGSVSYALHGADLLDVPQASGGLAGYGRSGRGRWVTIYANGGHVYMVVAGLRFDTTAFKQGGSRWARDGRGDAGYAVRHPAGL